MPVANDRAIFAAYLSALKASGHKYLVVGEAAATHHDSIRPIPRLEIWVAPGLSSDAETTVMGVAYLKLKAADVVNRQDLVTKIKIVREHPTVSFAAAYRAKDEARLFGHSGVTVISGADLVTMKLAAGDMADANRIFRSIGGHRDPGVAPTPEPDGTVPKLRVALPPTRGPKL